MRRTRTRTRTQQRPDPVGWSAKDTRRSLHAGLAHVGEEVVCVVLVRVIRVGRVVRILVSPGRARSQRVPHLSETNAQFKLFAEATEA